jgi:maleylpyruvate isomerase
MKLYTYFRSSAAYRVRIALALKQLAYDSVPVHLLRHGGEQNQPGYRAINPAGLIPILQLDKVGNADSAGNLDNAVVGDPVTLTQSLAILEYLDEVYPASPLLPPDPLGRARVRAMALLIACDIHPLNNTRVLRYLLHDMGVTDAAKQAWYAHWVHEGLAALEAQLSAAPSTGRFCFGDTPTIADCCLVPQVFNARRFGLDLTAYPIIEQIDAACAALPAFIAAHPANQPDAE